MSDYTNLKREMKIINSTIIFKGNIMKKKIIRTLLLIFGTGALFAQDSASGFRVQIYATINQEKAEDLKSEIDIYFPGETYITFEELNYKVRIGNCADRNTAENLLIKVQELGYPTAWIVISNIEIITAEQNVVPAKAVVESVSSLDGFAFGFNVGVPVKMGAYLDGYSGTNLGIIISTPYGLPLGPFNIGVGVEILKFDFPDAASGDGFTGMAYLGTFNIGLNDLPFFPTNSPIQISAQVGAGLFGGGLGTTIGGAIDIPLGKSIPLAVKLYGRGNAISDAGKDSSIEGEPTGWINAGIMITYDISSSF